jgi:hypothetical protein
MTIMTRAHPATVAGLNLDSSPEPSVERLTPALSDSVEGVPPGMDDVDTDDDWLVGDDLDWLHPPDREAAQRPWLSAIERDLDETDRSADGRRTDAQSMDGMVVGRFARVEHAGVCAGACRVGPACCGKHARGGGAGPDAASAGRAGRGDGAACGAGACAIRRAACGGEGAGRGEPSDDSPAGSGKQHGRGRVSPGGRGASKRADSAAGVAEPRIRRAEEHPAAEPASEVVAASTQAQPRWWFWSCGWCGGPRPMRGRAMRCRGRQAVGSGKGNTLIACWSRMTLFLAPLPTVRYDCATLPAS